MPFFQDTRKKLHGVLLERPADGSGRCSACDASCCRGFPSVELTAEEYAVLKGLGAVRLEFTLNGHYYLLIEHGCEFLVGNRCSIYDHRPAICRRFVCRDE